MTGAQLVAQRVHVETEAEAGAEVRPSGSPYAGFVTRTIAFAVDAAVINLVALTVAGVVTLVFSVFPVSSKVHDVAVAAGGVLYVIWVMTYFTTFWTTTGVTPGYRVMRIRLVRADGSALRPRHALVRLVGFVVSLPLLLGYLPILVTDRRRGLFDAMAGTVVVESQTPV